MDLEPNESILFMIKKINIFLCDSKNFETKNYMIYIKENWLSERLAPLCIMGTQLRAFLEALEYHGTILFRGLKWRPNES